MSDAKLTLGSLFDGISGFPYAAEKLGIKTVWTSEIERAPCEISKLNFPEVIQLGDVTKINGAEIPPVDIISFGSPCQDLSVAGQGAGLHEIPGALNCMHDQQSILAAYPINTQVVTRNNKDDGRTCFGIGENGDPGYTLQAAHSHGVIYAIDRAAFNQGENALYDFQINDNEINSTIVAKGPSAVLDTRLSVWVVRRLTPTECERLQGFPDDWTKYSDTLRVEGVRGNS